MLSSALKHGTTDHLAPHPRQIEGDPKLGVPPLQWSEGDPLGILDAMPEDAMRLGAAETAKIHRRTLIGIAAEAAGLMRGSLENTVR